MVPQKLEIQARYGTDKINTENLSGENVPDSFKIVIFR